jgi:hypothetical protein
LHIYMAKDKICCLGITWHHSLSCQFMKEINFTH